VRLGLQAQIGRPTRPCKRGADVANDVFSDMKMPVRLELMKLRHNPSRRRAHPGREGPGCRQRMS